MEHILLSTAQVHRSGGRLTSAPPRREPYTGNVKRLADKRHIHAHHRAIQHSPSSLGQVRGILLEISDPWHGNKSGLLPKFETSFACNCFLFFSYCLCVVVLASYIYSYPRLLASLALQAFSVHHCLSTPSPRIIQSNHCCKSMV